MQPPKNSRIPTAQQVLARQKADAEREHNARQAVKSQPPGNGGAVVPAGTSVPAAPDTRSSVQKYLDDVAPASIVGRMIKFTKAGRFETTDDCAVIGDDIDFIVLADQTLIGWVKFNGSGEPPDRVMGSLYDGFVMPPRKGLGNDDYTKWEMGLDGKPQDPWQHHVYLVLQNGATAELFTYVTSSVTGRRAIGNLLRHYDRMSRTAPDMFPVVRLKVGGFAHRDERVGWVATPVLAVVGRAPKDNTAKPDTALSADLNDEVPS